MNLIGKLFFKGLATVLPVALTIYLVYWVVGSVELVLRSLYLLVIPERYYKEGMGFVASIIVVILVGLLMSSWMTRWIFLLGEWVLGRLPLVRGLYNMIVDMLRFFVASERGAFSEVVLIRIGGSAQMLGLVTRASFEDFPAGIGGEGKLAVYLPFSYAMGGHVVLVDRADVQPVEMSREDALRYVVTAGMVDIKEKAPAPS